MSTGSIGVKAQTCRHLQCCSCCRLVNLLHQNSNLNCKSTHYLLRGPVRPHVGSETSHRRAIRAQCAYVLPTVPLMRASFADVMYLNVVCLIIFINLAAQRIEQTHHSHIRVPWGNFV